MAQSYLDNVLIITHSHIHIDTIHSSKECLLISEEHRSKDSSLGRGQPCETNMQSFSWQGFKSPLRAPASLKKPFQQRLRRASIAFRQSSVPMADYRKAQAGSKEVDSCLSTGLGTRFNQQSTHLCMTKLPLTTQLQHETGKEHPTWHLALHHHKQAHLTGRL